ncbi:hypothetical protein TELCIR_00904 [Teladorsagia circumcincta]|uniref:BTB domain-containing protein n=1 Tax=Teladorsagia circumcincta TaxID=45464 RepID=A0A2G9V3C0_TELCI|nr:hypothetical protein TELCIR_00904 [Teladorsagia circumcincta]
MSAFFDDIDILERRFDELFLEGDSEDLYMPDEEDALVPAVVRDDEVPDSDELDDNDDDEEAETTWLDDARPYTRWTFNQPIGFHQDVELCQTPLNFYKLFLFEELLDQVVTLTNIYGHQKNRSWKDTDAEELMRFIGTLHRVVGQASVRSTSRGCQNVMRVVHPSSMRLTTCPAHYFFAFHVSTAASWMPINDRYEVPTYDIILKLLNTRNVKFRANEHKRTMPGRKGASSAKEKGEKDVAKEENVVYTVEFKDTDALALEILVNFCYTGVIKINDITVWGILPTACFLQLNEVQKIIGTEGFYHLHVDQLVEVISSEKLRVHAEEQLLEHVRLPLCHPLFLVNTVSENASVKADAVCRDLVDEAKNYQLSKQFSSKLPNMQGPRTKPRKPFDFGGVLYIGKENKLVLTYL